MNCELFVLNAYPFQYLLSINVLFWSLFILTKLIFLVPADVVLLVLSLCVFVLLQVLRHYCIYIYICWSLIRNCILY